MTPSSFNPARRTKLTRFSPGHVFWLPKGATWLNRDKRRPYALATPCDSTRTGTLVYGSTQETEMKAGAAYVEVAPITTGVNANGLEARTLFYPGLMLLAEYTDLPAHAGILGRSVADFRSAITAALGIGSGSCLLSHAPAGSRRGRIVVLEEGFAGFLRTRFAVLVTEHLYSRARNYHLLVPIIRGDGRMADSSVLTLPRKDWFAVFGEPTTSVLLPGQATQSAWYAADIVRETQYVLDEGSMAALDSHLCAHFGLEPEATTMDLPTAMR